MAITGVSHLPGLYLTDHVFTVPLDHDHPNDAQITVYAREVARDRSGTKKLPWLIFFQGGPGGKSPRPTGDAGWMKRALDEFRVLLLDQRGTGRSTPLTHQTLAAVGEPAAQAGYLRHFRADSIVRDAERIRTELLGADQPWFALGQSYGGFCLTTYLSIAPEGLAGVLITGGIPPVLHPIDEVYDATYRRVQIQNERFRRRYPHDAAAARRIAEYLAEHEVRLPDASRLTPLRIQQIGIHFGASVGFEQTHYLLEEAWVDGPTGPTLSDTFLHGVLDTVSFARHPLYAILHESIYCEGRASNWSAERVRAKYPQFAPFGAHPFHFTGEMIYPWMFEIDPSLQPLRAAAELLATYNEWPALYDRARLQANRVPVSAAVFYDDMYVEREYSLAVADLIGNCHVMITNEYQHDAIRADGAAILDRLIRMQR